MGCGVPQVALESILGCEPTVTIIAEIMCFGMSAMVIECLLRLEVTIARLTPEMQAGFQKMALKSCFGVGDCIA